jgi:hypothetical protein
LVFFGEAERDLGLRFFDDFLEDFFDGLLLLPRGFAGDFAE